MTTITSANSKFSLTVRSTSGIVVGPFNVQQYASDDAFAVESVESAIARLGVDGKMAAGYVPFLTVQTINLEANSASRAFFDDWIAAQIALGDTLLADGALVLPSVQTSYVLVKGVLTRYTSLPAARRVLEPTQYQITWEAVQPAPFVI